MLRTNLTRLRRDGVRDEGTPTLPLRIVAHIAVFVLVVAKVLTGCIFGRHEWNRVTDGVRFAKYCEYCSKRVYL